MSTRHCDRRKLLVGAGSIGMLAACSAGGDEADVGAVEDLMREHGVIRRTILVYRAAATQLRSGGTADLSALKRAATLMKNFGEDYHERKLEEEHIFPQLKKAGGEGAAYVDVLLSQHQKGREITAQILAATDGSDKAQLAAILDAFELMYEHHAAREDTIVFPAWKKTMSEHQLSEMGEQFEDIEKAQFGGDGFDKAVKEIGEIEQALGLADIAQFTPR